jgi:AcrR family transcriptional regulator
LRERKKAATRLALRAAAVKLFRRYGPDAVTVEDICAEADVSPRTFFNYFAVKDEVVFGCDAERAESLAVEVACRPADEDALAAVEAVLGQIIEDNGVGLWHEQMLLLRDYPELLPRMQSGSKAFEAALADGLGRRTGRTSVDPYVRTLAAVALAAMRGAITTWLDGPEGVDPRRSFADAIAMVRSGFAEPE